MSTLNVLKSVCKWEQESEVFRNKLVVAHLHLLVSTLGRRPIPLRYWLIARSLVGLAFGSHDPLFPSYEVLTSTCEVLSVPELRNLLRNDVLGTWALDTSTIEFLWKRIQREQPKIVVECGAGLSTLVMAKYMATRCRELGNGVAVLSIEQDSQTKQALENRLTESGLHHYVRIIHAPVSESGKYELGASQLEVQLGSEKVDWILIDGPAGPEGCRLWTLPFLARFSRRGARWFLDDAFRDGELKILSRWSSLPGIVVQGIYPFGKGLGTGWVEDPERVPMP